MSLGLAYWICMLIWLILGCWSYWPLTATNARPLGGTLLLFVLLVLIGWQVFGAPLHT